MQVIRSLIVIILSLNLSACQKKDEPKINDVTESYRLIDAQRDDEAIALLERTLGEDPNNHDAKVALASAYAHKSGFRIQALWGMLEASRRDEIARLKFEQSKNSAASVLVNYLRVTIKVARALESIPEVDKKKYGFLEYAIGILDGLEVEKKRPSDHLFAALLRLVMFKSRVGWMYSLSAFAAKDDKGKCQLVVDRMTDSILDSARILEKVTFDLSYAYPKQQTELQGARARLNSFIQNLVLQLDTISLVDEASKIAFKNEAVQKGLGGLVQCSGDTAIDEI